MQILALPKFHFKQKTSEIHRSLGQSGSTEGRGTH